MNSFLLIDSFLIRRQIRFPILQSSIFLTFSPSHSPAVFLMIGIRGSVSPQSQLASFSKRLFSRSGIHEVEGPKLGNSGDGDGGSPLPPPAAPPADLFFHHQPSRRFASSRISFPSSSSPPTHQEQAIVRHSRRRLPPDYNSDIITINDILNEGRPKISSKNNDWIRTVGTSIQVRPDEDRRVVKGKVFDDVIHGFRSNFGK